MKVCAACHKDMPKDSYSKKQWKLDEYQRRCKVCTANNREVQPILQQDNNAPNTKSLDSMCLENVKKISDEELFKQPPPNDDCPICFLCLPKIDTGSKYKSCCGKIICSGCIHAPLYDHLGNEVDNEKCPFCRTPTPKSKEEIIEREKKRVKLDDPIAIYHKGVYYRDGTCGCSQDYTKALELFVRAAKLGHAMAYFNIGTTYYTGRGVGADKKKAMHYYELAAMGGNEIARCALGIKEANAGNFDRALKHYMIAARDGDSESLKRIKWLYSIGHATKEDYTKALQSYQAYLGEIKSRQRDEAAADSENCRYY